MMGFDVVVGVVVLVTALLLLSWGWRLVVVVLFPRSRRTCQS